MFSKVLFAPKWPKSRSLTEEPPFQAPPPPLPGVQGALTTLTSPGAISQPPGAGGHSRRKVPARGSPTTPCPVVPVLMSAAKANTHGAAVSPLLYATPPPPSRSGPKAPWGGGGGGGGGGIGGGVQGGAMGGGGREGRLGGGPRWGNLGWWWEGGGGTGSRYLPLLSLWGES